VSSASRCKTCGAPILWLRMTTGAQMPVDEKPQRLIVLEPTNVGVVRDCYTSHFATCPDAAQHRRAREK